MARVPVKSSPDSRTLPPWAHIIGTPDYDADGIPRYDRWELLADAAVHATALAWTGVSTLVIQLYEITSDQRWRYAVFSTCSFLLFLSSTLYNLVGCGLHVACNRFRTVDQATIFIYFGGCYTAFLRGNTARTTTTLAVVWSLCGAGALAKLIFRRRADMLAMAAYLALAATPLGLIPASDAVYPYVAGGAAAVFVGMWVGFFNNASKGSVAFWHACILFQNTVLWSAAFQDATEKK
jgi:channel protein (hemolysin III family)